MELMALAETHILTLITEEISEDTFSKDLVNSKGENSPPKGEEGSTPTTYPLREGPFTTLAMALAEIPILCNLFSIQKDRGRNSQGNCKKI